MTEPGFHVATNLVLPRGFAVEKVAYVGRTGSGKTYLAKKVAELFFEGGVQFVVLDPVGVWASLRRGEGALPVPILGGGSGDAPITDRDGALVADLVHSRGVSAVVDLSRMIDAEQQRFAEAFAARIFELRSSESTPGPLHVFLEEAQLFIPQDREGASSKMINRFKRLVAVGRNFGIGVSMVTQAPQSVHKRALNQAGYVFALQLVGKHERRAVEAWVEHNGGVAEVLADLAKLRPGEVIGFNPDWPEPKRFRADPLRSTDHARGATADPAAEVVTRSALRLEPNFNVLDVGEWLEEHRAEGGEKPAAKLRKGEAVDYSVELSRLTEENARLRLENERLTTQVSDFAVRVPLVRAAFERIFREVEEARKEVDEALLVVGWDQVAPAPEPVAFSGAVTFTSKHKGPAAVPAVIPPESKMRLAESALDDRLPISRRVLAALKGFEPRKPGRDLLAFLVGVHPRSKGFANALGGLRSSGWVEGYELTPLGVLKVNWPVEPIPEDGAGFVEWLKGRLNALEHRALVAVCADQVYRSREALAARLGLHERAKNFANAVGRLRGVGLLDGYEPGKYVR